MICQKCLENSQEYGEFDIEIEMDLVECFIDTYDHKGEHVQIDLGKKYICPDCDYEEPFVEEVNEDI